MSQSASLEFSALSTLDHGDHVCALYDSPPHQLRAVTEYVRAGLGAGATFTVRLPLQPRAAADPVH